jgi:thiol:disulfide interchange protein DsbD
MKIGIFLFLFFLSVLGVQAQEVVEWKFSVRKTGTLIYEVHLIATVEEGWHIYSQQTPKGGPLPTKVVFFKNPLVILKGKTKEKGEMEEYHDETFDVDVYAYSNQVDFVQVVQLKKKIKTRVNGSIEFMACTQERCLSPEKKAFSLSLE